MRLLPLFGASRSQALVLSIVVALAACSQADPAPSIARATAPVLQQPTRPTVSRAVDRPAPQREHFIAWGDGPSEFGYRAAGHESLAQGPSAISVLPGGEALVLDRLHRRVVRVDLEGKVVELTSVPADAEDLAVDYDGALAAFSPLRSTAWMYGSRGEPIGEVHVPRGLRDVQALSFGLSRRLVVRTALQETFTVGSPHAVASFESILRTRKEGAALLADGSGVAVQRSNTGRIDLIVLGELPAASSANSKTVTLRRIPVAANATSARVIGVSSWTVCIRLEQVTQDTALGVAREVRCLDANSGEPTFHTAIAAPGSYVPRSEFAMGGSPARLWMMHPGEQGLSLVVHEAGTDRSEPRSAL